MAMGTFKRSRNADGSETVECPFKGYDVFAHPLYNKSTGFPNEERWSLKLNGLIPDAVSTMDEQLQRVYASFAKKNDPMEKYIGIAALQDRDEHLFYSFLQENIEEYLPIVYTPTVGQACKDFSKVFRRGRGMWITPQHRGKIKEVLQHARFKHVKLIVATDNESILGIGDQGCGGMAISIGKLALYCAGAGIHPADTLPISLDVGTNNQELLDDPLYLGWDKPRLTGDDYLSLIDEFVEAATEVFPDVLIQWEDFRKNNAFDVLERYRHKALSFNDDIQGTGAVALAGLMAGCRVKNQSLLEQRIVIFGAGASGMGIANQLRAGMRLAGATEEQVQANIAMLDSRGLLVTDRNITEAAKQKLAWSPELAAEHGLSEDKRDLQSVVDGYRPTVLIGTSGQAGAFTESIVRSMASASQRPIILPFSNPTANCEAIPSDIIVWTEGLALVAAGSPFAPVEYAGQFHHIGQGNNVFIFPGLGLGALLAKASEVTDNMISASSEALATQVTEEELASGQLFPTVSRLREVSEHIAEAVVAQAIDDGVAQAEINKADIPKLVADSMWNPDYPQLVPAKG